MDDRRLTSESANKLIKKTLACSVLLLTIAACSANRSAPAETSGVSKYDQLLPATDFQSQVVSDSNAIEPDTNQSDLPRSDASTEDDGATQQVALPKLQPIKPDSNNLEVKPVLLLDRNYTIQVGIFDSHQEASDRVSLHNLVADEAGVAQVNIDGKTKYILAYGFYLYESDAREVAENLSERFNVPLRVRLLSEIEAISENGN